MQVLPPPTHLQRPRLRALVVGSEAAEAQRHIALYTLFSGPFLAVFQLAAPAEAQGAGKVAHTVVPETGGYPHHVRAPSAAGLRSSSVAGSSRRHQIGGGDVPSELKQR